MRTNRFQINEDFGNVGSTSHEDKAREDEEIGDPEPADPPYRIDQGRVRPCEPRMMDGDEQRRENRMDVSESRRCLWSGCNCMSCRFSRISLR